MTKRILLFVAMAGCGWPALAEPHPQTASVRAAATELWPQWNLRLQLQQELPQINVRSWVSAQLGEHGRGIAAVTRGQAIYLRSKETVGQAHIVAHELAHVYLNQACGNASPLVHESFAQWVSGDYHRVVSDTRFAYAIVAREYLQARQSEVGEQVWHDPKSAAALARLLSEHHDHPDGLDNFFRSYLKACRVQPARIAQDRLAEILSVPAGVPDQSPPVTLVLNTLSGRVLYERGNTNAPLRPGSVLKPLLLAHQSALMSPRRAGAGPAWQCDHQPRSQVWRWSEALSHSCNGFFLDGPVTEAGWRQWREMWTNLGLRTAVPADVGTAIGLVPGLQVSVRQVAGAYRWLLKSAPFIVEALGDTARIGTLRQAEGIGPLVTGGLQMKSGTVRDLDSRPVQGWIAAHDPARNLLLITTARGRAATSLGDHLARVWREVKSAPTEEVQVQVLARVPANMVTWDCGASGAQILARRVDGDLKWINPPLASADMATAIAYSCPVGALRASWQQRGGEEKTASYAGQLTWLPPPVRRADSLPMEVGAARARRGSPFILTTTEAAYIAGVLAAEFPLGRAATLQALAHLVRQNVQVRRHDGRPLCDTSHCQVFQGELPLPASLWRRIRASTLAALQQPRPAPAWRLFQFGGEGKWQRLLRVTTLRRQLLLPFAPDRIERQGEAVRFSLGDWQQQLSCEHTRNQLRLPSCPSKIVVEGGMVQLRGVGRGHGQGFDLMRADAMAAQGYSDQELLQQVTW